MRRLLLTLLASTVVSATPPQASLDPDASEQAALALVRSRDLPRLAKLLHDPQFLSNLPDADPGKTHRLGHILTALKTNANAETATLCHGLASDPKFMADPDRISFLLDVLAAVSPMTPQTADLFRRTALEGYFASNARLLAANGSPAALALFTSLLLTKDQAIEDRIECLRAAIVPRRTALPILAAAERILTQTTEPGLANGVVESVFDYRPAWFRPGTAPPVPPPWERASPTSLRAALRFAEIAQTRANLPPTLRRTLDRQTTALRRALTPR